MQKLFVPYELALLAKENAFDEYCLSGFLIGDDGKFNVFGIDTNHDCPIRNTTDNENWLTSPLYQQLVDWFREKHDTVINVYANASGYLFEIHDSAKKGGSHRYDSEYTGTNDSGCWDDYYSALNAAIEKAFTLLSTNQ